MKLQEYEVVATKLTLVLNNWYNYYKQVYVNMHKSQATIIDLNMRKTFANPRNSKQWINKSTWNNNESMSYRGRNSSGYMRLS